MTAAAFTAWQIMQTSGYKESFGGHLRMLGLDKEIEESREEVEETTETALRILKREKR